LVLIRVAEWATALQTSFYVQQEPVSIQKGFFAHVGVNLRICLCGDHEVASAQRLDLLDIGHVHSGRKTVESSTRSV